MIFFISFILLVFSSLLITAMAGVRQKPAHLIATFLAAFAQVILLAELASLLKILTLPFFLASQAVLTITVGLLWKNTAAPSLLGPWTGLSLKSIEIKKIFSKHPVLGIWSLGTSIIYAVQAILIIYVPQNNFDSMTYHLSRVAYWLQHQTLAPWATPNPRQTTFPMNAELGVLWTVMFSGSDRWSGFIQWVSVLIITLAIYGIARLLGARRSQGLFAGLLFANFPGILLQATTTQNDLAVSAFFMCGLYFLFLARRERQRATLSLSAVALAIAVGTKSTIVFILPAFVICILIDLVINKFKNVRFYLNWTFIGLTAFLLFGAFVYIQNQITYKNPFSENAWTDEIIESPISRGTMLVSNSFFYTFQMIDFSGIPEPAASYLSSGKSWFFTRVFHRLPVRFEDALPGLSLAGLLNSPPMIDEDVSWYGIIAFFTIVISIFYQLFKGLRTPKELLRWMLPVMGLGFLLTFSILISWSPYKGRYFILPITVVTPLSYFIYAPGRKRLWAWLISILSIVMAINTVLSNPHKPLIGDNAIWDKDRQSLRTISYPQMRDLIRLVDETVPSDAILTTRLVGGEWDYPLFGEKLQRTVIQLDPRAERVDMNEVRRQQADFLLISPIKRTFLELPSGLEFNGEANGWLLFKVLPEGMTADTPSPDFSGLQDTKQLIFLDNALFNRAGVLSVTSRNWGVETNQGHGVFWIGEKSVQGLHIYLWAEEAVRVDFSFQLVPGPGRDDLKREMKFNHYKIEPYLDRPILLSSQPYQLYDADLAAFTIDFEPGLNKIIFYCLDEATIRSQPNGDSRPLMVYVDRVDVTLTDAAQ